jgi:phosphocarrier protein
LTPDKEIGKNITYIFYEIPDNQGMIEKKTFFIRNRLGVHLRTASLIAKEANKFSSNIWLSKDGLEVDAKSIMGITLLGASFGSQIHVIAQGEDAVEAVEALGQLIESGFGED